MNSSTFDSFVNLIDEQPADIVHHVARHRARTIERTIKSGKAPDNETRQIMAFCEFLDNPTLPKNLSAPEQEFYRRTVARLVAAKKMPPSVMNPFS